MLTPSIFLKKKSDEFCFSNKNMERNNDNIKTEKEWEMCVYLHPKVWKNIGIKYWFKDNYVRFQENLEMQGFESGTFCTPSRCSTTEFPPKGGPKGVPFVL